MSAADVDVAIVGYGPVGQALAALLGGAGHRVAVYERFEEVYTLPRAVHLDHEIMRLLQSLGLADELADDFLPLRDYHWYGADGEPLMTLDVPVPAPSGWEPDYLFHQPDLEAALDRRARREPSVTVERGWTADGLEDCGDHIALSLRGTSSGDPRVVRARWVVGADGANSFVREARGIGRRDLGFRERWIVVDVEPHDMAAVDLPPACQWCDPTRPTTHIQSGTRHRRWEFMLLAGERAEDFADDRGIWELLSPWFRPQDGVLTRHAVYEFRSVLAERMRDGRVLLVGDAAHLTPPFLGQGLCSGLRDAVNVAWKLDLVLRGVSSDALLDTIDAERGPQNEAIIAIAIGLGRVLCELDADAAAERDATVRAAGPPPAIEMPPLSGGAIGSDPLAGRLALQGRVAGATSEGLLDDVTGGGFTLIVAEGDPDAALGEVDSELLDALGVHRVSLGPAARCGVRDVDGRLGSWLAAHAVHAVLVRPDFYVFGSVSAPDDLPALVGDLRTHLSIAAKETS